MADLPVVLVALHKLVPGILFLVYASEIQGLDDATTAHPHECSGDTDSLHEALVGRSSLAMLSVGAGICLLVDFVLFAIRFGLVSSVGLRGKLEAMNHLFEFFTAAIGAAVLHVVAQSEDGLAVQALYVGAGCNTAAAPTYDDHLSNGVALVGAAYGLVCLEFLIVRVEGLTVIPFVGTRLQSYFDVVTGRNGGCDLRAVAESESQYADESTHPILGYKDHV